MKKPWLAFLLNFLFAGAGLAYLGKWGWAVLNLIAVLALGFVLAASAPDSLGPASAGLAAASGGLAMAVAQSMNAKYGSQTFGQQSYPVGDPPPPYFPPQPVSGQAFAPLRGRGGVCGACGAQLDASKFCPQCGTQVYAPMPQSPAPYAPSRVFNPPPRNAARGKFCGDCGAELGASKFCPQCGSPVQAAAPVVYQPPPEPPRVPEPPPVPEPAPQPPVGQAVASGSRGKFCGDCGAELGASKFCPQCGTKVQPANQCAGCGAVFQSPAKFCPECGRKAA